MPQSKKLKLRFQKDTMIILDEVMLHWLLRNSDLVNKQDNARAKREFAAISHNNSWLLEDETSVVTYYAC